MRNITGSLKCLRRRPTGVPKSFAGILWLLLLGALALPVSAAKEQPLDRIAAIVEEDIILASEIRERVEQFANNLRAQRITLPPQEELEKRALDDLIDESIQLQMAQRMGIRVGDSELNQTMNRIAEHNGLSLEEFQEALKEEGLSYAAAREKFRREMITTRLQQRMVDARVRVTEKEVQDYLDSVAARGDSGEEYRLAHILLAIDADNPEKQQKEKARDILRQLQAGETFGDLAARYSDSGSAMSGGDLGWRAASELPSLFAAVVPQLSEGEVSDPLINRSGVHLVRLVEKRGGVTQVVSQVLPRHILLQVNELRTEEQAEALARDLYERITEKGESFGQLAKGYSDDSVSASAGGTMEWVSPGETVPAFEANVFGKPPGTLVPPFRTQFGWHIAEVLEVRDYDIGDRLEQQQARQILHRKKFDDERRNWLSEIRDEAYVQIKI